MARKLGTWIAIAGVGTLMAATACSSGTDDPAGTGGTSGDGDTGGTAGDGDGDGDTGGTAGDGDGDGSGGDGSGGSAPVEPTVFVNFDTSLDDLFIDWVENFPDPGMGGATYLPGTSLDFDDSEGEPDPGSAKLTVDYQSFEGADDTSVLRKVHTAINLGEAADFTGKTVKVSLKLVSGLTLNTIDGESACPFNSKIFIKTVTDEWIWGNGTTVDLKEEGTWITANFVVDSPDYTDDGFDATDTLQIGMEFTPSPTKGCVTDVAVFQIDSLSY